MASTDFLEILADLLGGALMIVCLIALFSLLLFALFKATVYVYGIYKQKRNARIKTRKDVELEVIHAADPASSQIVDLEATRNRAGEAEWAGEREYATKAPTEMLWDEDGLSSSFTGSRGEPSSDSEDSRSSGDGDEDFDVAGIENRMGWSWGYSKV
ncbi:uncharacterized protein N7459_003616 [Penicillium hispanicum]|uniref:uncharacterized protein n=1 Tax=Penicillium hispanicum TaxID=1080232 RepID=UPI0025419C2C|nr:uncharacterized protein N7459_003616 [Penicillium hispanicum]KAJ5587851.1 hypothetical protein N7459_003616 [Penicillium hispanicum]